MTQINVGELAPDFTLPSNDGGIFTLSEEVKKQPVVLVFYPMDNTPTCNQLLCSINQEVDEYQSAGLKVVGINYADEDKHAEYAAKKFLRLPLLSDNAYRVSAMYDSLFSIGPLRVIRYSVIGVGPDRRILFYQRGRPSNSIIISKMKLPQTK